MSIIQYSNCSDLNVPLLTLSSKQVHELPLTRITVTWRMPIGLGLVGCIKVLYLYFSMHFATSFLKPFPGRICLQIFFLSAAYKFGITICFSLILAEPWKMEFYHFLYYFISLFDVLDDEHMMLETPENQFLPY